MCELSDARMAILVQKTAAAAAVKHCTDCYFHCDAFLLNAPGKASATATTTLKDPLSHQTTYSTF
jgi:hypothetical protein